MRWRRSWASAAASLACVGLLALTGVVTSVALAAALDPTSVPPNWHVHDGNFSSCSNPANANDPWCQHKPVGFFWPAILGPYFATLTDYQADPARCPDATDKAFLPGAVPSQGVVLRSGACFTSSLVIHVRTVPQGTGGPDGWNGPIVTIERACLDVTLCPLQTWETWYLVVSR